MGVTGQDDLALYLQITLLLTESQSNRILVVVIAYFSLQDQLIRLVSVQSGVVLPERAEVLRHNLQLQDNREVNRCLLQDFVLRPLLQHLRATEEGFGLCDFGHLLQKRLRVQAVIREWSLLGFGLF